MSKVYVEGEQEVNVSGMLIGKDKHILAVANRGEAMTSPAC